LDKRKWLVIGRGIGGRLIRVIYLLDDDQTVFVIHAMPLTTRRRRRGRWGNTMAKPKMSPIDQFIALPDSEKEKIVRQLERESTEHLLARSRPLNAKERKQWRKFKAKMGRPKIGKGSKTISLTVEKDLLARADAYAKRNGISRAKLVAQGLRAIIGRAAWFAIRRKRPQKARP
jgi:hypothetical protein